MQGHVFPNKSLDLSISEHFNYVFNGAGLNKSFMNLTFFHESDPVAVVSS